MDEREPAAAASGGTARPGFFSRWPGLRVSLEAVSLFSAAAFFIFYGLVPVFGGAGLGLVGADEPRYAQVAREMLSRHDFITPYLWGHPWLEKPALYYWRAMFAFRQFGVHDWSARIPSAEFAFLLVVMIYLHIRRFRPGGELAAGLITASCVGIIGFARGASTDMQLAAPFFIGMLGWYAWYETDSKFWLFDLYFFGGAATLAKGPVAPFLAILIIVVFAALRREWSLLRRTIWLPGLALYFAMVLPWFIEVQIRNPTFLRVFFLQQNLERFSRNRYFHEQPHWYYFPIMAVAILPWTVIAVRALVDAIRQSVAEWRVRRDESHYVGHTQLGDAFPEFLVLSTLIPPVFFSFSQSKLPGYILPAIPPLATLTGDYLNRIRRKGVSMWLLVLHGLLLAATAFIVLLLPDHIAHHGAFPSERHLAIASLSSLGAFLLVILLGGSLIGRFHVKRLLAATVLPMVLLLFFIVGIGPFFGIPAIGSTKKNAQVLDAAYSARPLAFAVGRFLSPHEPVAVFRVRRDIEYGLSFYLDRKTVNYDESGVPAAEHILVVRNSAIGRLRSLLAGRKYVPLFSYTARNLTIYRVFPEK